MWEWGSVERGGVGLGGPVRRCGVSLTPAFACVALSGVPAAPRTGLGTHRQDTKMVPDRNAPRMLGALGVLGGSTPVSGAALDLDTSAVPITMEAARATRRDCPIPCRRHTVRRWCGNAEGISLFPCPDALGAERSSEQRAARCWPSAVVAARHRRKYVQVYR